MQEVNPNCSQKINERSEHTKPVILALVLTVPKMYLS